MFPAPFKAKPELHTWQPGVFPSSARYIPGLFCIVFRSLLGRSPARVVPLRAVFSVVLRLCGLQRGPLYAGPLGNVCNRSGLVWFLSAPSMIGGAVPLWL